MPSSPLSHYDAHFFSTQRVYPWIHKNFSEDGYAYFISLGVTSENAIHLASTKVNTEFFRAEAELASAGLTDTRVIQNKQLDYLRTQIEKLTSGGSWNDDLQKCIDNIALSINSEESWGNLMSKTEEIGIGERLVYRMALERASELKKAASQVVDASSSSLIDIEGYAGLTPPPTDMCIIL